MSVLDIISYWWPLIAAVLAVVFAGAQQNPAFLILAGILVVLQIAVVIFRGGLFVAREAKARSAQEKYDDE